MMIKPKRPFVPAERHETIRRDIVSLLEGKTMSARELSSEVGIREKEAYDHLEHIQISFHRGGSHLVVTPAECESCGFVFKKRDRLKKPGKCPVCSSESITAPLFRVEAGRVWVRPNKGPENGNPQRPIEEEKDEKAIRFLVKTEYHTLSK